MKNAIFLSFAGLLFLLLPWYYLSSGMPQPVDLVILCLLAFFSLLGLPGLPLINRCSIVYRLFCGFSLYTISVLLLNYIVDLNSLTSQLLLQNLYYMLLVTIFTVMLVYLYRSFDMGGFYKIILFCLLIDSLLPMAALIGIKSYTARASLTFNNPNQLGFYALINLCVFSYVTLLAKERKIAVYKGLSVLVVNINLLFIYLSLSRACYPAIILYLLSYPLIFELKFRGYALWLSRMISCFIVVAGVFLVGDKIFTHMLLSRTYIIANNHSDLMIDIYYRAIRGITANFSQLRYFLIGNGTPTTDVRANLEFHNNFFATFNELGILGLLFYLYINLIIIKELYKKGLIFLVPFSCYLFYSMFQYSYRTRMNWLFLAVIIFIILEDKFFKSYRYHNDNVILNQDILE